MNEKETKPRFTFIDSDITETITELAKSERRSFAGQVNYLLRLVLKKTETSTDS